MSIEVRVPTILRSYTGGQKVVTGAGETIAALLADLDAQFPGLRARLITEEGALHKFVNVYINDEDIFAGVVDGDVLAGLEEAQLANLFGADAAGGEIGDAAGFEFEPDIGDIDFAGENGQADGGDLAQR